MMIPYRASLNRKAKEGAPKRSFVTHLKSHMKGLNKRTERYIRSGHALLNRRYATRGWTKSVKGWMDRADVMILEVKRMRRLTRELF